VAKKCLVHFHKFDKSSFEVCRVAAVLADGCSETLVLGSKKMKKKKMFLEKEKMKKFNVVCCVLFLFSAISFGTPIAVGSGQNSAGVRIEWSDGYVAEFLVSFNGNTTGMGLLNTIAAETTLVVATISYGSDKFVDGFSFNGHSNIGYNYGENWWHYYTKSTVAANWISPNFGASDRIVSNDNWDGWSYGHEIPEPTTIAILSFGSVLLARKRK
jgi:hypothetical protein